MTPFDVYSQYSIEPIQGESCYIYDQSGTKYLDFYGGHAVISIGHRHPHYVKKIKNQLDHLGFYSNAVNNSLQIELAKKLGQLSGCETYQLFLCNSGAEANENALKLASFQNKRSKIIAFHRGFHGRTSAAVNVTDNTKIKATINTGFETQFFDLNEWNGVEKSLQKKDVCAVIVEGIQGIGGVHLPHPKWLEKLKDCCQKNGTLLILDEIQSGYGRSGKFFAFQHSNVQPDLITVAKGMGNGFPIGGVLIHPNIKAKKGQLGSTFGGNHLACAAGIAVLDVLKLENLMGNASTLGTYFLSQLKKITGIKNVRGKGLMIALELPFTVADFRKEMLYEHKIFTGSSSDPNVLRILPPLNISKIEVDYFIQKLTPILKKWNKLLVSN